MKFFHPQIQLARETVFEEPDAYSLHVVTFCPRSCYSADGHTIVGFGPNDETREEGIYKVTLQILKDTGSPDFAYITPVVHTISLGSIDFPDSGGTIEVQVDVAELSSSNPPQTGGKGTVSTTDGDSNPRPIPMD